MSNFSPAGPLQGLSSPSPVARLLVMLVQLNLALLLVPLLALFPKILVDREPGPFVALGVGCVASAYGLAFRRRWMILLSVGMILISGYALVQMLNEYAQPRLGPQGPHIPIPAYEIALAYFVTLFGIQIGSVAIAARAAVKLSGSSTRWTTEIAEFAILLCVMAASLLYDFSMPAKFRTEREAHEKAEWERTKARLDAEDARFKRKNQEEVDFLNDWARARTSGDEKLYEGLTTVLTHRMTEGPKFFPPNIETFVLQADSDSRRAILDLTLSLREEKGGEKIWVAHAILDSDESGTTRRKAVETLLRNGYEGRDHERNVSAAPVFREILEESPEAADLLIRLRTVEAIRDLGAAAEQFLPEIDRMAANEPHPTLREAAKEAAALIRARVNEEKTWHPSLRSQRLQWTPSAR